jgi:hypothetical protein
MLPFRASMPCAGPVGSRLRLNGAHEAYTVSPLWLAYPSLYPAACDSWPYPPT